MGPSLTSGPLKQGMLNRINPLGRERSFTPIRTTVLRDQPTWPSSLGHFQTAITEYSRALDDNLAVDDAIRFQIVLAAGIVILIYSGIVRTIGLPFFT